MLPGDTSDWPAEIRRSMQRSLVIWLGLWCTIVAPICLLVAMGAHLLLGTPVWVVAVVLWVLLVARPAFGLRSVFGGKRPSGGPGAAGIREPREPRGPLLNLGATAEPDETAERAW